MIFAVGALFLADYLIIEIPDQKRLKREELLELRSYRQEKSSGTTLLSDKLNSEIELT